MSDTIELAGVAEIADALGVNRSSVSMWDTRRRTSGFPEPIAHLACGRVYDMAAIRSWWASRQGSKEDS